MSVAQLRAFFFVAQHGSFSGAARAMGLTQPTLTMQVQALEKTHKVELFHRRGHGVELSAVGQRLLPIARQLSALELDAYNLLHDSGELQAGDLRLGAVGPFHVIEMVDAYRRRYPRIDVSIRMGNSSAVFKDLEDYVVDIGVLARFHEAPGFAAIPYARHDLLLFVEKSHAFAARGSVRLEELHGQAMLQRESGSSTRRAMDDALREAGVKPKIVMEIGSREALREAAARGIGIGAVSEAEFIPDPRLVPVRIEGRQVFTETYLYCLAERRDSRVLNSFFDVALSLRSADSPA
ncbi:LysR substrate-binding domain-containing protein [Xylophilus sp. GW821-FHT01B05]